MKVVLGNAGEFIQMGEDERLTERRREFRARLVRAGRIVQADGEPGLIVIPAEVIRTAVNAGLFNGLAVFVDHPQPFENASMKALVGVTHSAVFNEATQSADAVVRFYAFEDAENANPHLAQAIVATLDMMLADRNVGVEPPNVGFSLVFWPKWARQKNARPGDNDEPLTLAAFKRIDSADIVFSPAADGRILEALSTNYSIGKERGRRSKKKGDRYLMGLEENVRPGGRNADVRPGGRNPVEMDDGREGGENDVQEWVDAARRSAVPAILLRSGLPAASQERLRGGTYGSPQELETAIQAELDYLGRLSEDQVIHLPGGHPRGAGSAQHTRVSQMTTGLDHARNAVDYLFGVPDAAVPEPMLRRSDMLYIALTGDYEWHGVFRPDRVMLTGADTTTLANLATNAMNKVVAAQLSVLTFYRWYEKIAVPTPNDGSLHDMSWISFGGITTLPTVPEKGSYSELDVDDVKEADSFVKYGGYVGITREMLRKSQIQRIQAVPRALAAASVKTRSAKIAAIFTANSGVGPTLDQDSTALFHANHNNVATTALGTDLTAWRAAALECFKHTEVSSSDRIGTFPKYCLVPPDLYHQALANFGYGDGKPTTYLPEAEDRGLGDPRPVPLAVPHFTDANDWAYITDPMVWPVIHMSFSADPSGRTFPAPEIFAVTGETAGLMFTNDTLPVKVRDEFAYGVNGYRGIGKRNVA
ncbi:MAG: hypothetical protein WAM60_20535 [Candidatus Promineifilaceae bacterium]